MAEYTKVHSAWADFPDTSTPVTATALDTIEAGIANAVPKDAVTVAGTRMVSTKLLSADTYAAFLILGDGGMQWGGGGSSPHDVNLYRPSAGILRTDNNFVVNSGGLIGIGGPSGVLRFGYGASDQINLLTTANAYGKLRLQEVQFDSDVNLYRSAANTLKTDDAFVIGDTTASAFAVGSMFYVDANSYRVSIGGAFSGSGNMTVFIKDTNSAPASNPTAGGLLYVESGALKYRGSSGTITTIANA